jgi:murein DD-endopeptidase MepM/ murein hydrolase activator NlpD
MRFGLKALTVLTLLAANCSLAQTRQPFQDISWSPSQIETGSPCLFKVVTAQPLSNLHGTWQGHDITFFPVGQHGVWYGLAVVDVEVKPGSYSLGLTATLSDGKGVQAERTIAVLQAPYKSEKLRVPNRYVQPDAETLRRIESDKQFKKAAFSHEIAEAEWSGKFLPPIDSTESEGFGTRRTFNGKLASIHRGLDYHAKVGTPVTAANSGEVVLARELFYEGNCVIIDHGQRFMTLYMHLSKLTVGEGDKVEKGQQIGLSGATGRATGPHLHMALRWQDAYLDPAQLWALPLPVLRSVTQSQVSTK